MFRKLIASAILGASIVAGSLVGAGSASANSGAFTDAMHNAGYGNHQGDSALVAAGHEICDYLYSGYSFAWVQRHIYAVTDLSIDYSEAGEIVRIAQDNLC